jgi:hypothetical protein
MKKIALIAALIVGTASAALAEDSSSSFAIDVYGQSAQQQQVLINRDVALPHGFVTNQAPAKFDRAGNPYAGGGF